MVPSLQKHRLAASLALLALLVRVLLPALHDHKDPVSVDAFLSVAIDACPCGVVHPASTTDRSDYGDFVTDPGDAGEHHCIACKLEMGTPFGCPPETSKELATPGDLPLRQQPPAQPRAARPTGLPAARAPPTTRVRSED